MRTLICKTLFLVLLPLLTGWANAAMLSSEVRSLSYMAACADGSGGLWLLVGESAGGWANDDFLSVSAWHASAAGEREPGHTRNASYAPCGRCPTDRAGSA